jgi:CheY-like chemotaxis protein
MFYGSMSSRTSKWLLCLALGLVTLALYLPALKHAFQGYDDQQYVTENPRRSGGTDLAGGGVGLPPMLKGQPFDLVILDYFIPRMQGSQFALRFRDNKKAGSSSGLFDTRDT